MRAFVMACALLLSVSLFAQPQPQAGHGLSEFVRFISCRRPTSSQRHAPSLPATCSCGWPRLSTPGRCGDEWIGSTTKYARSIGDIESRLLAQSDQSM
jgi:hypothetical protein